MKKKIKKLAWPLFAPIAFILWTVDYYLVYFGLSFFFYKLTTGNSVIRIILVLLAIPIVFFLIKIFYDTTFFTAFLVSKNKFIYFLFALLYSLNRIQSVLQYCAIKAPTIPDSVIMELPCAANLFITFGQITLILGLGLIFLMVFREESTGEHNVIFRPSKDFNDQVKEGIKKELSTGRYPNLVAQYKNHFNSLEQNIKEMLTTQYKKQISEIGTCLLIFELDAARYKASNGQGELFSDIKPRTLEKRKVDLENKLDRDYQTLESEQDDFIEDEVEETGIVRVLGIDIDNIMHKSLYYWAKTDQESLENQVKRFSKDIKDKDIERATDFLEGKLAYRADKWNEIESIIANNLPPVVEEELIYGVITRSEKPIEILGEMIYPGNQPILYRKAKVNKPELERQLKSIAEKWHDGSVRAAILALESDLEHG